MDEPQLILGEPTELMRKTMSPVQWTGLLQSTADGNL
jgi:hypothetical protein